MAEPGANGDDGGMTFDRAALGAFLRARRESLQPEDVGLRRGSRRRARGLRREEVAELCDMSADYFARLERGDGPQPSEQMMAAVARGLRLTPAERDHLFLLCGYAVRPFASTHVSPGLMRIMDRLADTPAQVIGPFGETLVQTVPAVALLGAETGFTGHARSAAYRWFTDPSARDRFLTEDHPKHSRFYTAALRAASVHHESELVGVLLRASPEFAALWERHEVGLQWSDTKRFVHPQVGRLDLFCQTLQDPDQSQSLLVFTATPGTESHEKLALLAVLGTDTFSHS